MKVSELVVESKNSGSLYKSGMCDAFAIALHDLTGYPLAAWGGKYWDDLEEEDIVEYCHVVVMIPNSKKWIDVDGIHEGVPQNCHFSNQVNSVKLYPLTRGDALYVYTGEGVSDSDIADAKSFIKNDSKFSTIVK